MMSINLINIAILNINGADYRCIINGISKSDVVKLLQNANLTKERRVKIKKIKKLITIYKMGKETTMLDNTEVENIDFTNTKVLFPYIM